MIIKPTDIEQLDVYDLIAVGECEILDFKSQYPTVNSDLVFDLICLSNVITKSVRLLIFGVSDVGEILGIETDPNRKNLENIIAVLRACRLNTMPKIYIKTKIINGHEIDLIIIEDQPQKPFFLLADYTNSGRPIRAGVVYSRDGDSNTPINSTTPDGRIELMYRERMGFDKTAIQRMMIYLSEKTDWKYGYNNEGLFFYHQMFPEFTVQVQNSDFRESYTEGWSLIFPDQNASRDTVQLKYHGTVLDISYLVWLDGARLKRVQPISHNIKIDGTYYQSFFYIEGSVQHLLNEMTLTAYPDIDTRAHDDLFPIFSSNADAQTKLNNDFASTEKLFTYYFFDKKRDDFIQIYKNKEWQLHWKNRR